MRSNRNSTHIKRSARRFVMVCLASLIWLTAFKPTRGVSNSTVVITQQEIPQCSELALQIEAWNQPYNFDHKVNYYLFVDRSDSVNGADINNGNTQDEVLELISRLVYTDHKVRQDLIADQTNLLKVQTSLSIYNYANEVFTDDETINVGGSEFHPSLKDLIENYQLELGNETDETNLIKVFAKIYEILALNNEGKSVFIILTDLSPKSLVPNEIAELKNLPTQPGNDSSDFEFPDQTLDELYIINFAREPHGTDIDEENEETHI